MEIVTAARAASLVHDGDTVLIGGSGGGHAVPERLMAALEERFLASGAPRAITSIHPVGLGNGGPTHGASHFAHEGLLKRIVCGTFVDAPPIAGLASENLIEAYTLPQGALSLLIREIAGGRPGLLTHVGLHTFIDPRHGGGRQSERATEDLIEVVELAGREWLFYKPFPIDVAFLRGTTADEDGNVTMEHEAVFGEMLSMAQAARRQGGIVVVQVKRLARRGTLPPKQVKIPGLLVDLVVVDPDQAQTFQTPFDPAYAGELRIPLQGFPRLPLDQRKIIARRCALELYPGAVCNVGSGVCTGISLVAAEEGILDQIVLTNEQGLIGGAPASGREAGASRNYDAIIDQPYQFDFYDGGGLDLGFLSAVEIDGRGNVNISRFGGRIIGVGGFVNISQNAKTVVFGGTFTAGGLEVAAGGGRLTIRREGQHRKFVSEIGQLSYSATYAAERGQRALYITERAVFELGATGGLVLSEVAPGIDLERDVLAQMGCEVEVPAQVREMDPGLFEDEPMGLAQAMRVAPRSRHPRLEQLQD